MPQATKTPGTKPRPRYFVGCKQGTRELFTATETPTEETHGDRFAAVIGPFKTKRAAVFMAKNGANNPHLQTVADAERHAREAEAAAQVEDKPTPPTVYTIERAAAEAIARNEGHGEQLEKIAARYRADAAKYARAGQAETAAACEQVAAQVEAAQKAADTPERARPYFSREFTHNGRRTFVYSVAFGEAGEIKGREIARAEVCAEWFNESGSIAEVEIMALNQARAQRAALLSRPRMLRETTQGATLRPFAVLQIEDRQGEAVAAIQDINTTAAPVFVPLAELRPDNAEDLRRLADEIEDTQPETARALRLAAHDTETKETPRAATVEACRLRNRAAELEDPHGDARNHYSNANGSREEALRIAADARQLADRIEAEDLRQQADDRRALFAQRRANGFAFGTVEGSEGRRLATYGTPAAPLYIEIREYDTGKKHSKAEITAAHYYNPGRTVYHLETAPTFAELLERIAAKIGEGGEGVEAYRAELAENFDKAEREDRAEQDRRRKRGQF